MGIGYSDLGKEVAVATTIIKRSEIPVTERGGKVSVRIADNGQFGISKKAMEIFSGTDLCLLQWDGDARKLTIRGYAKGKTPKQVNEKDCFSFRTSEKQSGGYFSASGVWKQLGYDYRESGSQSFSLENGLEQNGQGLVLSLPEGALPRRPVTRRKRKQAEEAASTLEAATAAQAQPEAQEEVAAEADDLDI